VFEHDGATPPVPQQLYGVPEAVQNELMPVHVPAFAPVQQLSGAPEAVQNALAPHKPLAYTTVMTLLERLLRKGAVTREKHGRHFVYAPAVTRETLRRVAVRQLADAFFDGSETSLIRYLENNGGPPPSMADVLCE